VHLAGRPCFKVRDPLQTPRPEVARAALITLRSSEPALARSAARAWGGATAPAAATPRVTAGPPAWPQRREPRGALWRARPWALTLRAAPGTPFDGAHAAAAARLARLGGLGRTWQMTHTPLPSESNGPTALSTHCQLIRAESAMALTDRAPTRRILRVGSDEIAGAQECKDDRLLQRLVQRSRHLLSNGPSA
jgi:hypothetical protein